MLRYKFDKLGDEMNREWRIRFGNFIHKTYLPALTEEDRTSFLLKYTSTKSDSAIVPTIPEKPKSPISFANRKKADLIKLEKETMALIWENRGYYGTLETGVSFDNFDWEAIWTTLEIDPKVGRGQLIQAVKQFTQSPQYTKLIKILSEQAVGSHDLFEIKMGLAVEKNQKNQWWDSTLWPYLTGEKNEALKKEPKLFKIASTSFGGTYLNQMPEVASKLYAQKFRTALNTLKPTNMTIDSLSDIHKKIIDELHIKNNMHLNFTEQIVAEAIDKSALTDANKKDLLTKLFFTKMTEEDYKKNKNALDKGTWSWINNDENASNKKIIKILKQKKVINSSSDVLKATLADPIFRAQKAKSKYTEHFNTLAKYKDEIIKDLLTEAPKSKRETETRLRFIKDLFDPGHGQYSDLVEINGKVDDAGFNIKDIEVNLR